MHSTLHKRLLSSIGPMYLNTYKDERLPKYERLYVIYRQDRFITAELVASRFEYRVLNTGLHLFCNLL